MTFTTVPTVVVGDLWDEDDFNTYLRDNFAASVPDIFTTKGDIAVGTGSKALSRLGVGNDGEILIADSGEITGMKWSKGKVEIGMIIIWSGAVGSVPTGWQICDGTNGTPDLRDRFVAGAGDSYAVDATGGATTIDIRHRHDISSNISTEQHRHHITGTFTNGNNESAHTHSISSPLVSSAPTAVGNKLHSGVNGSIAPSDHTHTISDFSLTPTGMHSHSVDLYTGYASSHSHTFGYSNYSLSSTQSILPKYYALCFIQRVS